MRPDLFSKHVCKIELGLSVFLGNSYSFIVLQMATQPLQLSLSLPEVLRPWLVLNLEFHMIICYIAGYQQALGPGGISDHLLRKHQVKLEPRWWLAEYLE